MLFVQGESPGYIQVHHRRSYRQWHNYTTSGPVATRPTDLQPDIVDGGNNSPGNPPANDPISMTFNAPGSEVTSLFCSTDFVLRMLPITYSVDVANPTDPQLTRTQCKEAGKPDFGKNTVMDQVIGFKVGAALRNGLSESTVSTNYETVNIVISGAVFPADGIGPNAIIMINNSSFTVSSVGGESTSALPLRPDAGWQTNVILNGPITQTFNYDYLNTDYNSDYTLVRAVRVTIIGRTTPSTDPTYTYRNPFDLGAYQIRGSSIIVNPRNLTMNDF